MDLKPGDKLRVAHPDFIGAVEAEFVRMGTLEVRAISHHPPVQESVQYIVVCCNRREFEVPLSGVEKID